MSVKQHQIMSTLLAAASESPQSTRIAAAICRGSKILAMTVNNHRTKFGNQIRCSGHAEIACLYKLFPFAFQNKRKGLCVL
jgi:hypothetical protein